MIMSVYLIAFSANKLLIALDLSLNPINVILKDVFITDFLKWQ